MKKTVLIVLLIIVIAAGVVLLKKRRQVMVETPVAIPMTSTVRTVRPETRTVLQTATFLAGLEFVNSAGISSKLTGRISDLLVQESQQVRQGDLLLRIDDHEIRSSIAALNAKLNAARKQHDYSKTIHGRNKALFDAGGLAREKLEASEVAYSTAAAAVKELEQNILGLKNQLEYAHIKAPFAGTVGTIFLRRGDLATPGRPILSLNAPGQKLTFSFVPGDTEIQPEQDVLLLGVQIGKISTLYNDARAGLQVAEVIPDNRIDQPNKSYLTIEVITGNGSGCAVPVQSLLHREQGMSIMVYDEDHFTEKAVSVTIQGKEFALIEPCVSVPVAVASEVKLSLLPTYGSIRVVSGVKDE